MNAEKAILSTVREVGSATMLQEARRVVDFATLGGFLLTACLGLVWAFDSPSIVFLAFVFMVGLAPPICAALVFWGERHELVGPLGFSALRLLIKVLILWIVFAAVAYAATIVLCGGAEFGSRSLAIFSLVPAALALLILRLSLGRIDFSRSMDTIFIVALALVVFIFSPFNASDSTPIGLLDYAISSPNFWLWLLVGGAWTTIGVWLRRREGWAFGSRRHLFVVTAIMLGALFVLLLYDDSHFVDFAHYMVLVGPAVHATRGGIPMVDAYSIYGLGTWLIHVAAYEMFSPTFGTSAVVVRVINLLYFAVILTTLLAVTRRRISALWFFVPAILVALTSHGGGPNGMWNMNALPMTLGGRNLLPAVTALVMALSCGKEWGRWASLPILMIASLSSVEILVFALAPWGYCLLLEAVRTRSARLFLKWSGLAMAGIALAQLAFLVIVYLTTGKMVDYRPYFSLFFQFRPAEESIWSVPFVPYYALWLPIGFAYFSILALAGFRALRADRPDSLVDRLVPVAAFALGPLAYFMGRPQEATLNVSCLPFAVVAIAIAEIIFVKAWRYGRGAAALAWVMACAFAFVAADGFEHFMRPSDPRRGNSSVLRRCFSGDGCRLGEVGQNVWLALHSDPLDPRTGVGRAVLDDGHRQRIEEVVSMLRRVAPESHTIGMLTDIFPRAFADSDAAIGITAFMYTGQWYAWSLSSPINDGLSPVLVDRILQQVAATPSGTVVIARNGADGWAPLNTAILERLRETCDLRLLERGRYHTAFVTEGCRQ